MEEDASESLWAVTIRTPAFGLCVRTVMVFRASGLAIIRTSHVLRFACLGGLGDKCIRLRSQTSGRVPVVRRLHTNVHEIPSHTTPCRAVTIEELR